MNGKPGESIFLDRSSSSLLAVEMGAVQVPSPSPQPSGKMNLKKPMG